MVPGLWNTVHLMRSVGQCPAASAHQPCSNLLLRYALLLVAPAILPAQAFDVLITGARIVDGSGNPWYSADRGISGDRIAAIGRLAGREAGLSIDGTGLIAAPGFIDIHTHAARFLERTPALESAVRQGVTTVMEGQDGSSPLPLTTAVNRFAKTPVSINFGFFAGQGSIRAAVIGTVNRKATADELARMKALARQAMLDGAFGLSTGLFYVPGNFTPTDEIVELAKVVGELGGIHISHMRDEAAGVLDSVRDTIRIGEEGKLPTQITHHKIIGAAMWGASEKTLRLVDEARARGVDVTIDQYPYTASHTGLVALFPQWALEGGRQALLERVRAPQQRARIKAEISRRIREDRGGGDPKISSSAAASSTPRSRGKRSPT
jgi:N-acyl-D-amino-acid deacylase